MNLTPNSFLSLAILAGISFVTPVLAVVNIDYVAVGNPGNANDPTTGYGSVAYNYQIGKYEVTNSQYTSFLNAADPTGVNANGIYNTNMGSAALGGITYTSSAASGAKYTIRSSMGNKPVNFVSWYDAARFCNWLHNGQGGGSTETGAYTLAGAMSSAILKNGGTTSWIPSENEWYKAAYYDPTPGAGGGDNYWLYPTQSDIIPVIAAADATGDISNPGANVANYLLGADWNSQNGNVTTVGSAAADNFYGTFDQGGNVWEWNDAVSGGFRGFRGGTWDNTEQRLRASNRVIFNPTFEVDVVGFRVATVPEPTSILLTMLAGGVMLIRRKR